VPGEDNVKLDSVFLLASVTKPMVAAALMRLVEEGRLLLNRPVAEYLPEFGANGKERVTPWHLLTHSSGLDENESYDELFRLNPPPTSFDWLWESSCRAFLHWEPGTAYRYNSLTFSVLAQLITRLGGLPYPEYMRRHIFEPLGMKDTAFQPQDTARAAPIHYAPGMEALNAQKDAFISRADPGGGLWGTAADVVRFGQAFLNSGTLDGFQLLSPASVTQMTGHYTAGKSQLENGRDVPFNYGLGWGKPSSPPDGDTLASPKAFGHTGISGTMLWVDPEYDLVFVFLSNLWGAESDTRGRALNAVYRALSVNE
jgi:CubicO group peptidase (beta-lactamase class C family)